MTVGRYPLSSVKRLFRTGQPNNDGDPKHFSWTNCLFSLRGGFYESFDYSVIGKL